MLRVLFWAMFLITTLIMAEAGAALIIFHHAQFVGKKQYLIDYDEAQFALQHLVYKLGYRYGLLRRATYSVEPSPSHSPHPELGFTPNPGHYEFTTTLEQAMKSYKHSVTILQDGSRITSYTNSQSSSGDEILIFGDSIFWGDHNNDEQTFPWLLQARYPNHVVRNFAVGGYGNVHELVQIKNLPYSLLSGSILLVGYADYMLERNVAAARWSAGLNETADQKYAARK